MQLELFLLLVHLSGARCVVGSLISIEASQASVPKFTISQFFSHHHRTIDPNGIIIPGIGGRKKKFVQKERNGEN
mgnify:FL=1